MLFDEIFGAAQEPAMRLHTHAEREATVVAVAGEVDACNATELYRHVCHLIRDAPVVIVDLSRVGFFGVAGLRAIIAIDTECRKAEQRWAVVSGDAVNVLLRLVRTAECLPVANSMSDARQIISQT